MPWYVLITKPRSEKKVAERLINKNIEVCCPLRTEIRQWSDRKKKVSVPLLPSMVLINLQSSERHLVFETPGIIRYLHWLGEPATVSDREVDVLREINSAKIDSHKVEALSEGVDIELKGFGHQLEKGTVKYISGNQCWVVLHSLGYVIKLNI